MTPTAVKQHWELRGAGGQVLDRGTLEPEPLHGELTFSPGAFERAWCLVLLGENGLPRQTFLTELGVAMLTMCRTFPDLVKGMQK